MAASRLGPPTPPTDDQDPDHRVCPVCGWRPCTRTCRLGIDLVCLMLIDAILAERMLGEGVDPAAEDPFDG